MFQNVCILLLVDSFRGFVETALLLKEFFDTFVILDVSLDGSATSEAKDWALCNHLSLHVKRGYPFFAFDSARNDLLDFADISVEKEWYMLLDLGDEVIGNVRALEIILPRADQEHCHGVLFKQVLFYNPGKVKRSKCACIKARSNWRYEGLVYPSLVKQKAQVLGATKLYKDAPIIYSNREKRTQGDAKLDFRVLSPRCHTLQPREMFYFARACEVLGKFEAAELYYTRSIQGGIHTQKVFCAHMSLGRIHLARGRKEEAASSFLEAYEHEERVEPLLELAKIHGRNAARIFLEAAVSLKEPKTLDHIFPTDMYQYDYVRWVRFGEAARAEGDLEVARMALKKSLAKSSSREDRAVVQRMLRF